jgi:molybdate transport system substrate-binding protein
VKSKCKVVLQIVLFVDTLVSAVQSSATEITFLCAAALESWMVEVIPAFQKTSGYNVKPTFQIINDITERVRRGDAADLATVSTLQWEDLQRVRKLAPDVRVVIAKVGFGVFVKKGAAKPDIRSVEAFKRTFMNARSIAFFPAGRGPTGAYQVGIFEQLGISVDIEPKIKYSGSETTSGGFGPSFRTGGEWRCRNWCRHDQRDSPSSWC